MPSQDPLNSATTVLLLNDSDKIDILSLCPMLVTSNMTRNRKSILSVSTEQCATSALRKVGKVHFTLGYWFHEVQYAILDILPDFITNRIQKSNLYALMKAYKELDQANAAEKKAQ